MITRDRDELISWIADESLGGDRLAAEWVLVTVIARVYVLFDQRKGDGAHITRTCRHARHPDILPPSLTLIGFPPPPLTTSQNNRPALAHVLSLLLPLTGYIELPKNLAASPNAPQTERSNTKPAAPPVHFAPRQVEDDLHSGVLQLPSGTAMLVLEAGIEEGSGLSSSLYSAPLMTFVGTLPSQAVENLQTLRGVLRSQTLLYKYPFSSGFEFHTDIPAVILCEGGKARRSLFLPDVSPSCMA